MDVETGCFYRNIVQDIVSSFPVIVQNLRKDNRLYQRVSGNYEYIEATCSSEVKFHVI